MPIAAGLKVLVVEDHPTNRRVVQLMLEALGAHVSFAENGREGVDAWARAPFDAVLMDVQMPVMDGLAAVTQIRRLEADHGLPRTAIAMLSANVGAECEAAAALAGADDYICKPVSLEALIAGLTRAMADVRIERAPPQARAA